MAVYDHDVVQSTIDLDHRRMYFSGTHKIVAWGETRVSDCSAYYELSALRRTFARCSATEPKTEIVQVWSTNETKITLAVNTLEYDGHLLLFNLTAINSMGSTCQTLPTMFQLDPEGIII